MVEATTPVVSTTDQIENPETKSANTTTTAAAPSAVSKPSEPKIEGPRRTPFHQPASSVTLPTPAPLTNDQATAYNSLLNTVSTWTSIGETSDPNSEHTPLHDEELIWLTRECLLRYLRASKWVVTTAQTRLLNTLLWRRTYGIVSARPTKNGPKLKADYISEENETGKQCALGYDNAGRPCLYLNPSKQNTKRSDRQIEHLVFMLERAIDLMPAGQETLALLINFAETSSGQGATVGQGKQTLNILQNHYPERLGRALLCNLPWHIWAFMKVITPFIDPVTREKIVYNEPLEQHVPPEQLLKTHGGQLADFEYDHTKYWPALNELVEQRRKSIHERWVKGGRRVGESELYLKSGTEESLSQEEDGRLSKERGTLRGRTLLVGEAQRREKSVSIVADGDEATKLEADVNKEGDAASKINNAPKIDEAPEHEEEKKDEKNTASEKSNDLPVAAVDTLK